MDRATDTVRPWTRDSLADHLESEVVPQVVRSGQALPSERALSETLGVSRSLVREVLRGLEQRGLVDILPGKGAYPRRPSMDDAARVIRRTCMADGAGADHLIEARTVLEVQAVSLAADRCTPDDVAILSLVLDDRDSSQDFVAEALTTVAFHALIVRCTMNPVLIALHASLCPSTFESMLRAPIAASARAQIGREGREIIEALAVGHGLRAEGAMLRLLELERTWTGEPGPSRPEAVVTNAVQRTLGPSPSIEDYVAAVISNYSPGQVARKVAHA